jgi:glyoxylate/hydroxypyruvate reductase A
MAILCALHPAFGADLLHALQTEMPDESWLLWEPDSVRPGDVEAALIWRMRAGMGLALAGARFISATGAGVDHLLSALDLPTTLPLTRINCPHFSQTMAEYCLAMALNCVRDTFAYADAQQLQHWRPRRMRTIAGTTVGILGVGFLGSATARLFSRLGFRVLGWARTQKHLDDVCVYTGKQGLSYLLQQSEILINLLPLTDKTKRILNRDNLFRLPRGAALINAARGEHLVEPDLIEALDAKHLSQAVLDCFSTEPLPSSSPLWKHRQVLITPHVAAQAAPGSVVNCFRENLLRNRAGMPLLYRVDRELQY